MYTFNTFSAAGFLVKYPPCAFCPLTDLDSKLIFYKIYWGWGGLFRTNFTTRVYTRVAHMKWSEI